MITTSKRVMHMAHALYNHFHDLKSAGIGGTPNWGESLTEAWRILRVREALSKGVLYIVYSKGLETQCRRATLCPKYLPSSDAPKGSRDQEFSGSPTSASVAHSEGRAEAPVASMSAKRSVSATRLSNATWGVINYYDLDKMGWRSFKIQSLLRATPTTVQLDFKTLGVGESIYG